MKPLGLPLLVCLWISPALLIAQGSLVPPAAPAPTMKTLQQIEPRTPISAVPFTINAAGSYYLTTNLTGTAGAGGIDINADNVTVDLGGFTISNAREGVDAFARRNIVVRNGTFDRCDYGVSAVFSIGCTFERLHALNTRYESFNVGEGSILMECVAQGGTNAGFQVGANSSLRDCAALGNGQDGFFLARDTTMIGCVARGNARYGINASGLCTVSATASSYNASHGFLVNGTFNDCIAEFNGLLGFSGNGTLNRCAANNNTNGGISLVGVASGCTAVANRSTGIGIDGSAIGCTASGNIRSGIVGVNSASLKDCVAAQNGVHGIEASGASSIVSCTARDNTTNGIHGGIGTIIKDCVSFSNGSNGVTAVRGAMISGCTVQENTGNGIVVNLYCSVIQNNCNANGRFSGNGAGVLVIGGGNRIEGNHCTENDRGIEISWDSNLIIRNLCHANSGAGTPSGNYDINVAAQFLGTILTSEAAMNASSNPNSNISIP